MIASFFTAFYKFFLGLTLLLISITSCQVLQPGSKANTLPMESLEPGPLVASEVQKDSLGYVIYDASPRDLNSSQDHPLVSRYPGSFIMGYQGPDQQEFILPLGLVSEGKFFDGKYIDGTVTSILYQAPKGSKVPQIFESFREQLTALGFKVLFRCQGNSCQDYSNRDLFASTLYAGRGDTHMRLPVTHGLKQTQKFLSAWLVSGDSTTYLTLMVKEGWWESPAIRLDISEN